MDKAPAWLHATPLEAVARAWAIGRGRADYENGRVQQLRISKSRLRASVAGTFDVRLRPTLAGECRCADRAEGNFCRHLCALYFAGIHAGEDPVGPPAPAPAPELALMEAEDPAVARFLNAEAALRTSIDGRLARHREGVGALRDEAERRVGELSDIIDGIFPPWSPQANDEPSGEEKGAATGDPEVNLVHDESGGKWHRADAVVAATTALADLATAGDGSVFPLITQAARQVPQVLWIRDGRGGFGSYYAEPRAEALLVWAKASLTRAFALALASTPDPAERARTLLGFVADRARHRLYAVGYATCSAQLGPDGRRLYAELLGRLPAGQLWDPDEEVQAVIASGEGAHLLEARPQRIDAGRVLTAAEDALAAGRRADARALVDELVGRGTYPRSEVYRLSELLEALDRDLEALECLSQLLMTSWPPEAEDLAKLTECANRRRRGDEWAQQAMGHVRQRIREMPPDRRRSPAWHAEVRGAVVFLARAGLVSEAWATLDRLDIRKRETLVVLADASGLEAPERQWNVLGPSIEAVIRDRDRDHYSWAAERLVRTQLAFQHAGRDAGGVLMRIRAENPRLTAFWREVDERLEAAGVTIEGEHAEAEAARAGSVAAG